MTGLALMIDGLGRPRAGGGCDPGATSEPTVSPLAAWTRARYVWPVAFMAAVVVAAQVWEDAAGSEGLRRDAIILATIALVGAWLWRAGLHRLRAGVMALAALTLALSGAPTGAFTGLILAVIMVAANSGLISSMTFTSVGAIAFALIAGSLPESVGPARGFSMLTFVAAFAITRVVRQIIADQVRVAELLDRVRATEAKRVELAAERAKAEERERIAREMHDVLAHTLSAVAIQLQGTRMLLERRRAGADVIGNVDRSYRLAYEGMEELQQVVRALRSDALPGPELLPRLVAEFEADTGVASTYAEEGVRQPVGAEVAVTLYRCTQEALTNVRKHATPEQVEVRLRYGADAVELEVEDRGVGGRSSRGLPGSGFGLLGMRERAELVGGQLDATRTPSGFRVRVRLPIASAAVAAE